MDVPNAQCGPAGIAERPARLQGPSRSRRGPRALSFWVDRVKSPLELLRPRINDPHPRVRLEAVRALSFLKGDGAIELALDVLNHDLDDYLQYTLDETMRALEQ